MNLEESLFLRKNHFRTDYFEKVKFVSISKYRARNRCFMHPRGRGVSTALFGKNTVEQKRQQITKNT